MGSPDAAWTHTSESADPGGSVWSRRESPAFMPSRCRSRLPKTMPCTVDLKWVGRPGGNRGGAYAMGAQGQGGRAPAGPLGDLDGAP
jgi:hypothetical protein